jgi:hypothetical protein
MGMLANHDSDVQSVERITTAETSLQSRAKRPIARLCECSGMTPERS